MLYLNAMELFLEHLQATDRSPITITNYGRFLAPFNNYLSQRFNRPAYVDEVTPDDFERYLFEPPNDTNFSQTTRFTISTAFKSFYSFCYLKGFCQANIGKKLTPIKAKSKERTFITEDELLKIVAHINSETARALMQTMFYTGMRIGEATSLTFEDINFRDNYITVRKRKSRYDRKIPISIKLRLILNDYLDNYREVLESESDLVFVLENGTANKEFKLNTMLKLAAQKAGLNENISSHVMRHSFASNLIAKGVDIVKIKKLLGHEQIKTTNIYLHTNMELLRNAIDRL